MWVQGQPRDLAQRNNALDVSHLHHGKSIDAKNHVKQRSCIHLLAISISVQHHAAFHARIQNVIDLQHAREDIDNFRERSVRQIQSARRRRRHGGGRGLNRGRGRRGSLGRGRRLGRRGFHGYWHRRWRGCLRRGLHILSARSEARRKDNRRLLAPCDCDREGPSQR